MTSGRLFVGIDLGGTKISTALVHGSGEIAAHDYRETRAGQGPEAVIGRMLDAARGVMARAEVTPAEVAAVGIGAPGPLDIQAGVVIAPPNLPGWDHVPLKQLIEDGLGITATKNMLPMQPGDVEETCADVGALQRDVDFHPDTPIEVGVERFLEWYRHYYGVPS